MDKLALWSLKNLIEMAQVILCGLTEDDYVI